MSTLSAPPRRPAHGDAGDATDQTASLLADLREGAGDSPLLPQKARRRLPTQHLVTLLVLVAGGGGLVAMRKYGMGAGMRFDNVVKVEYVQPVNFKRSPEQDRVLADLERGVAGGPLAAGELPKNPFVLALRPAAAGAPGPEDDEARRSAQQRQRRSEELKSALAGIVLNGVMGGSVPLARVNGQIVRVGDTVGGGLFQVAAIQGRSILLVADGQPFTIEMSEESSSRPGPPVRMRPPGR